MTFNLDPAAVRRAGRASVDTADTLDAAASAVGFGDTTVDDSVAQELLRERIRSLGTRLRANGTNLRLFAREADKVDGNVGYSFLVLSMREWQ